MKKGKKVVNSGIKSEVEEMEGQLFVKPELFVVRDCCHDVISYNSSSYDPKVQPHYVSFVNLAKLWYTVNTSMSQ
jgi:hypothetical protein